MIEWQLTGLTELLDVVHSLPDKIQNKALRPGVEAGCRIIAKTAKQYAPVESGTLKSTIDFKVSAKGTSNVSGVVGNRSEQSEYKGQTRNPAHYSHLVEYGHAGQRGPAAPHPFLRPAVDTSQEQVQAAIGEKISKFLDKLD